MPYGYDFNVTPVQVENGTDYQARKDAAAARKQELQIRQMQIEQAKKAKGEQDARDAAAKGAYQPSSYTPPQTGINVGGANLGYQPATVQGPSQFNRGSYLQSLQQSDPLGAMDAQQHFQQQDMENQKAQVAFQDSLTKADTNKLELAGKQLDLTARMLGGVKSAPPEIQAQVYQGVRQQAIQMGLVQPNDPQVPEQFPGAQWLDQKLQSTLPIKDQIDNELKRREQDIQVRGQDTTAATARAGQAVTMRGQNMVDARTKETQGSQVMEVPQPDGSVKLQRVKVGDTLPGGAQTVAAAQKSKEDATVDEKKKADLVTNARENLAALRDIITRRPELFGPYAGRLTSLRAAAGTSDEDISKLAGIKDRFGMVNQGLHSMRSASHVAEAGDAVLNKMRNSPEATLSAINEAEKSLDTFQLPVSQQRGNLSGNAGGGLQIIRDAQGRITGVK